MESLMSTKNANRQVKKIPKRTTLLQKTAYILRPFVLYMLVKTAAMLLLAIAIPSLPIAGITAWVERNSHPLSAVVNGVASLVAVSFLLKDFLIEASTTGEVDIDKGIFGQMIAFVRADLSAKRKHKAVRLMLCIFLGITASLALNIMAEMAAQMSEPGSSLLDAGRYEAVEAIQYSVPVAAGIILYGIISPIVEEIVFRGVLFQRIRKFYSMTVAVGGSALLFGMFHGNLPQFLYGTAMGAIMAVCYMYIGSFAAPLLVHMSANLFTFLISGATEQTAVLLTPVWCVVFTVLSAVVLWYIVHFSEENFR